MPSHSACFSLLGCCPRAFPPTLAILDCSWSCSCVGRSFHSFDNSLTPLFVIVRYFPPCFLRCPRCYHFDAASVVPRGLFSVASSLRVENTSHTLRYQMKYWDAIVVSVKHFLPVKLSCHRQKIGFARKVPLPWCTYGVHSNWLKVCVLAEISNWQTPEMTHWIFLESECFLQEINDEIK